MKKKLFGLFCASKSFVKVLAIIALVVPLSGCSRRPGVVSYSVNLEMWGLFDDTAAYSKIFNEYRQINKSVQKIIYRKFTEDEYRDDLLNALASGTGPKIFLIHNTWLPSFKDKLAPMPNSLYSEAVIRSAFVDVVGDDFIDEGRLYALPLSVDSLALYYNKDILNSAGITNPPQSWEDFVDAVKSITIIDRSGNIERAGAAIGTAPNVNRASDLVTLLMLQNETPMMEGKSRAKFDTSSFDSGGKLYRPGENALAFYTQFAQLKSEAYTWNKTMPYSIDAFVEGKAAMMINYSWHYETIKRRNAKLNFGVAPVPQISLDKKANYANYWAFAVAKDPGVSADSGRPSKEIHEAWQFVKFLTMPNNGKFPLVSALSDASEEVSLVFDPALSYLETNNRPAARRDIIDLQKRNPLLQPFADGNLVAKRWHQRDPKGIEAVFLDMIDSVNTGQASAGQALRTAATRVTKLSQAF